MFSRNSEAFVSEYPENIKETLHYLITCNVSCLWVMYVMNVVRKLITLENNYEI